MILGADIGVLSDVSGVVFVVAFANLFGGLRRFTVTTLAVRSFCESDFSYFSPLRSSFSSDRDRAITHNEAHNAAVNNPQSSRERQCGARTRARGRLTFAPCTLPPPTTIAEDAHSHRRLSLSGCPPEFDRPRHARAQSHGCSRMALDHAVPPPAAQSSLSQFLVFYSFLEYLIVSLKWKGSRNQASLSCLGSK